MKKPEVENLKNRTEVCGKGQYDYDYRFGVGQTRSGKQYAYIGGFRWDDNQGGYQEAVYAIDNTTATDIRSYIGRRMIDDNLTNADVYDYMVRLIGDPN